MSERLRYVATIAWSSLRSGGWFQYSPLGTEPTRAQRRARRWHNCLAWRVLQLSRVIRATNRAYREELGR